MFQVLVIKTLHNQSKIRKKDGCGRAVDLFQKLLWSWMRPNLDGFELAGVQGHFKTILQGTERKTDTGIFFLTVAITFEVQVAGSIGVLSHGAWVDLEGVYVVGIPGHHHIVPLVVIERLVGVALHQRRPVAEIKDVVDKPVEKNVRGSRKWVLAWWPSLTWNLNILFMTENNRPPSNMPR